MHIKQTANSCFYQLRQLWSIPRYTTTGVAKSLVHSFVTNGVDYCNCALFGAFACSLRHLQAVKNVAARFISQRRKFDHISDALRDDLHWLLIQFCIGYKLRLLMYTSVNNL